MPRASVTVTIEWSLSEGRIPAAAVQKALAERLHENVESLSFAREIQSVVELEHSMDGYVEIDNVKVTGRGTKAAKTAKTAPKRRPKKRAKKKPSRTSKAALGRTLAQVKKDQAEKDSSKGWGARLRAALRRDK